MRPLTPSVQNREIYGDEVDDGCLRLGVEGKRGVTALGLGFLPGVTKML